MRRLWIHFGLCLIVLAGQLHSEQKRILVRSIRIHGLHQAGPSEVRSALIQKEGSALTSAWPQKDLEQLAALYHKRGYFQFSVDSVRSHFSQDSNQVRLSLWVHEGRAVRIGSLSFAGLSDNLYDQAAVHLMLRTGERFNDSALKEDLEVLSRFLANHGYPLSKIVIAQVKYSDSVTDPLLDIRIRVETGPQITVGSVRFTGNGLTRQDVLARELRIHAGDMYDHKKIKASRQNLIRLEYLDQADAPQVRFEQGKALLTYAVKEGNPNTLDGVVGYTPSKQEGKSGYFTGRLQFAFRNLFGTGRFFEAFWQKKDAYSQSMRFGYQEPWVLGYPIHAGGEFTQEIQDSTYINRVWLLGITYQPRSNLAFKLDGGQKAIYPDSLGSRLQGIPKSITWQAAFSMDYSTLDDAVNPRKGVHYESTLTVGRKRNTGPDWLLAEEDIRKSVNTRNVQVHAEGALPLFRRQVIYLGLHGLEVNTGDRVLPVSEQVRFGGATTLRGYAEDAFRGKIAAWCNLEYRYLLGRRSRVFLFADTGMYQRHEKTAGVVRNIKWGFGFGLRLETRLGVMAVDYGLGEGDGLMQGKIHVGLENRF